MLTQDKRIVTEKNDLGLRGSTGGRIGTERSRVPTTSLVNERRTYGRDEDKKAIIKDDIRDLPY